MDNPKLVGERIRKAREDAGLTQEELGKKTGFSAMGVSYLEKGKRKLKLEDLSEIAKALKVSVSYLLEPITGISVSYPSITYARTDQELSEEQKKEFDESRKTFDAYVESLDKKTR